MGEYYFFTVFDDFTIFCLTVAIAKRHFVPQALAPTLLEGRHCAQCASSKSLRESERNGC
jgi:hypothetical protein